MSAAEDAMSAPDDEAREPWVGVFVGLCVAVVLTFTAFGAAVPVLPRLIDGPLGGPDFAVGAAFALSATAALLGRPYIGRLAQRVGSRRVMVVGAIGAALVALAYALAETAGGGAGLGGILVIRVVMGVAEAAVFTSGSLWVVVLAPESRRGQIVGFYGLSMWSGWTLGPIVGEQLREHFGYGAVWIVHGVLPILAILVLLRLPAFVAGGRQTSRTLVPLPVVLPGLSLALGAVGYQALAGFVVLFMDSRGAGNGSIALSLYGAAYILVRLCAGRLPDRAGPGRVAAGCGLVEAAGLVIIATAHSSWQAGLGAFVMGAGFTLLYPSLALVAINRTSPAERGAALGAFTSFWDLGLGAAGLITGAVAALGYPEIFVVAAVSSVAASAVGLAAGTGRSGAASPRAGTARKSETGPAGR